jgi:hypothetical protein
MLASVDGQAIGEWFDLVQPRVPSGSSCTVMPCVSSAGAAAGVCSIVHWCFSVPGVALLAVTHVGCIVSAVARALDDTANAVVARCHQAHNGPRSAGRSVLRLARTDAF